LRFSFVDERNKILKCLNIDQELNLKMGGLNLVYCKKAKQCQFTVCTSIYSRD